MCQSGDDKCIPCKPGSPERVVAPSAETLAETPAYNVVYEQLVANRADIVGQLAYCLYKQSKQHYLREFERLNCRRATEAELLNHVACAEIPALDMYREKAELEFSWVFRQAVADNKKEMETNFKDRLWLFINRHQPESFGERSWLFFKSLTFGGLGGVIGNFLTTVIVLLLLFGAATSSSRGEFSKSAKESLISGLAEVMGVAVSITRGTPGPASDPIP